MGPGVKKCFSWIAQHKVLAVLLALMAAQLACSLSASAPPGESESAQEPLPAAEATRPAEGPEQVQPGPADEPAAILEARRLNLEWPSRLRAGDSGLVHLTLEVDDQGNLTPTAIEEGNLRRGETVLIPDLYDTHDVWVEARLEIAGAQVAPQGEILEPLQRGRAVSFVWSVRPGEPGSYRGTVWVHLNFVPKDEAPAGAQESRVPLTAQNIEFQVADLFGLSGLAARVLGGVGSVVGSIFGLDNLVGWGWKRLKKLRHASKLARPLE